MADIDKFFAGKKKPAQRMSKEARERLQASRLITSQKRDARYGGDAGEEAYDAIREPDEQASRKAHKGKFGSVMPVGGRDDPVMHASDED